MSKFDFEAVKQRCEAATEGPWHSGSLFDIGITVFDAELDQVICRIRNLVKKERLSPEDFANGDFIAHARTDLPAALAEIERLQGLLSLEKATSALRLQDNRDCQSDCDRLAARVAENEAQLVSFMDALDKSRARVAELEAGLKTAHTDALEAVVSAMEDPAADWCQCGGWCVEPSEVRALAPKNRSSSDE